MENDFRRGGRGTLSVIFSGCSLLVLMIELPLGTKPLEGIAIVFFVFAFATSVLFAALGIVLGSKGSQKFNDSLAQDSIWA